MKIKLRPYQEKAINDIIKSFYDNDKILFQLPTGGGKTFTFSFLAQKVAQAKPNKKVYILVNRTELVNQTVKSLSKLGVRAEEITAKTKKVSNVSEVYVAMVETFYRRVKKEIIDPSNASLAIIDECHRGEFDKILPLFDGSKVLGVTATPVRLKKVKFWKCSVCGTKYHEETKQCHNEDTIEWIRPFRMSEIYQDIVVGTSISNLIKEGSLIEDNNFLLPFKDEDKLVIDASGEFSKDSLDKYYSKDTQIHWLYEQYQNICKGKKTMIFVPNTRVCNIVTEYFKSQGIEAKGYDSKNNKATERKELVKWFEDTPNGVLVNVNVFTTGFDVTDVESIIIFRSTMSLALWLQMVGRGARPTDKIYKPSFDVIDLGGNLDRHNKWSDNRDWEKIFYKGLGKTRKKREILDYWTCTYCDMINDSKHDECQECENPRVKRIVKKAGTKGTVIPFDPPKPPNPKKIIQFTIQQNENKNFALNLLSDRCLNLFQAHQVTKNQYLSKLHKFDNRIKDIIRKNYFPIIGNKEIASSKIGR